MPGAPRPSGDGGGSALRTSTSAWRCPVQAEGRWPAGKPLHKGVHIRSSVTFYFSVFKRQRCQRIYAPRVSCPAAIRVPMRRNDDTANKNPPYLPRSNAYEITAEIFRLFLQVAGQASLRLLIRVRVGVSVPVDACAA